MFNVMCLALKVYGGIILSHLHNVCFVDSGHFAAAFLGGVVECKFSDTARFIPGDDFQALNHS